MDAEGSCTQIFCMKVEGWGHRSQLLGLELKFQTLSACSSSGRGCGSKFAGEVLQFVLPRRLSVPV